MKFLEKYSNFFPLLAIGCMFTACNLAFGEQKGIVYVLSFSTLAAIAGLFYVESWRYYTISTIWLTALFGFNFVVYRILYPNQLWPSVFGSSLHEDEPNYLTGSVLFLSLFVIGGAVILLLMSFCDRRAVKKDV